MTHHFKSLTFLLALTTSTLARADIRIQGAGATFPAPLYAKWCETYNKTYPGIKIDYQSVGSGAGIKAITDRTLNFGATDAPFSVEQEKALPAKVLQLPTVAGASVIFYNLEGAKDFVFTGEALADIYLKKITRWNDPKLAALNPTLKLTDLPIVVVHRSDGSGTTYGFTDFLSKSSQDWSETVGRGTAVEWPTGIAGKGGDGPAAAVRNTPGSIGYIEFAYAQKNNIPFATLLNQSGKPAAPTTANVEAAAAASLPFPDDLKVSITNAPGDNSYPLCAFTYLLIYQDLSYLNDEPTARATVEFLLWCETEGQKLVPDLGYARLPEKAQAQVVAKLKSITFNGNPLLK